MEPSPPRVLLLSLASFNRIHGGGITLSNLFRGWPRDRIAMIHGDDVAPTTEICDQYFVLGGNEIRRLGPLLGMRPPGSAANGHAQRPTGRAVQTAKQLVFGNMLPDSGRLTPTLVEWIERFRPTVVYSILGSNAMMDLAHAICDRFGAKLVVHFMDDWPSVAYRGGVASFVARRRMDALLRAAVDRAELRLGISPAMCREYERRFGHAFLPFMNAVDVDEYPAPTATGAATKEILYVGSILPHAQLGSLVDSCQAVSLLRDRGIHLTILTSSAYFEQYRAMLAIAPNVALAVAPPDSREFVRLIQSASTLLLPVNFDHDSVNFIRYSLPTKLPAYLAAGTPILAYGPRHVAQIAYAREEGWAHVVCERSVTALSAAMDRIVHDEPLRDQLGARGRLLAREHHALPAVRQRFQETLTRLS